MQQLIPLVKEQTNRRWAAEVTPKGKKWKPNHAIYAHYCKPASAGVLVKTGRMKSSIEYGATSRGMWIKSALPYSSMMFFGGQTAPITLKVHPLSKAAASGTRRKSIFFPHGFNIPARPFIGWNELDVIKSSKIIKQWILTGA